MTFQQLAVTLLLMLFSHLGSGSADAVPLEGQWLIDSHDRESVNLTLTYRESGEDSNWHTRHSRTLSLDAIGSLDADALFSTGAEVRFEIRRDAGTFACEGWTRNGKASGHFVFRPDAGFTAELVRRGWGTPSAKEQLALALADAGRDLMNEIDRAGYDGMTIAQFTRMAHHGVTASYIRGLRELGYEPDSADSVVRMRDHGVTLDFIRQIQKLGIRDLDDEGMVRLRDHGVTPDFIKGIGKAGHTGLEPEELVRLRDHGVTPDYMAAMQDAGLTKLTIRELVRLRDHGVTAEYVRDLKAAGLENPTAREVVRLRDHGVRAADIRALRE